MRTLITTVAVVLAGTTGASAATLSVGPTRSLKTPSSAAATARNGDTVLIDAGTYIGDVATWTQNNLTLRGVGGPVVLDAAGKSAQGKGIWVIAGNRTTVDGITFVGATVPDQNGAGIRQEGSGLIVRRSTFRNNENGILAGENRASDILIENSIFTGSGFGDGQSHNIYIGTVRSFTMRFSVSMNAKVGHEVKSRALRNDIRYNTLNDGNAAASYSIDLPNGGVSRVVGNLIIQGPNSENTGVVAYGLEGLTNPDRRLWLAHNTIVNRIPGRGTVVNAADGAAVTFLNNALAGDGTWTSGAATQRGNARVGVNSYRPPGTRLVNRAVAVLAALAPRFEPAGTARRTRPVVGRRDVGALERRR